MVVQFLFCFLKVLTCFYVVRQKSLLTHFMPLISFSLKSSKNQRFFDVSRGYRKRALIRIASKRNLEIRKLNQNFVLNLVFLFISFWDIFWISLTFKRYHFCFGCDVGNVEIYDLIAYLKQIIGSSNLQLLRINPFHAVGLFLYPLKTSENHLKISEHQRFSDNLGEYRKKRKSLINPSHPMLLEICIKIKINLRFYFRFSLWCLRRFYEGLKGI